MKSPGPETGTGEGHRRGGRDRGWDVWVSISLAFPSSKVETVGVGRGAREEPETFGRVWENTFGCIRGDDSRGSQGTGTVVPLDP